METYSVDVEPRQIVRWLRDERRNGRLPVDLRATRSYEIAEGTPRIDDIGGDAAEPLAVVTAVGVLDITPPPGRNGWVLTIRVEDESGPRLPEDEPTPEDVEEIDFDTFDAEFIAPDRGAAFVNVDAESDTAMARCQEFLDSISGNIHPA